MTTSTNFIPISGVGAIGANMFLIQLKERVVCIDCGILFSQEEKFGVNHYIPDLKTLTQQYNISDLIITHTHEDHVGAVEALCHYFPKIKIYASEFAKYSLHYLPEHIEFNIIESFQSFSIGDCTFTPIDVIHSVPNTFAILINRAGKSHLFASDFKTFPSNSLSFINKVCPSGIDTFFADSTNVLVKENLLSENDVQLALEKLIRSNSNKRIFVTFFSSNVERLNSLCEISNQLNLPIYPHGRSIRKNIDIGKKLGLIKPNFIIEDDQISKAPMIVLLSGCQADYKGTFTRVARGEDALFEINNEDILIYSARPIPGNEKAVGEMLNRYVAGGATIFSPWTTKALHATGHASQNDLSSVYQALRPKVVIPIHGEKIFLKGHCDFIAKEFPNISTLFLNNCDTLCIDQLDNYSVVKGQELALIPVHGESDFELEAEVLQQRRRIARKGVIFISIELTSIHGKNPKFHFSMLGLPTMFADRLKSKIEHYVNKNKLIDRTVYLEQLQITLRRDVNKLLDQKPEVIIHLV